MITTTEYPGSATKKTAAAAVSAAMWTPLAGVFSVSGPGTKNSPTKAL